MPLTPPTRGGERLLPPYSLPLDGGGQGWGWTVTLYFIFNNFHLQMGDRARWIQVFGTYLLAVEDCVTAPYTMFVVYNRQTLLPCAVSCIGHKPIHIENGHRSEVLFMRSRNGTRGMATGTQNTINQNVNPCPFVRGLYLLPGGWRWFSRYQVRFYVLVLFPERLHIGKEVFVNDHVWQGTNGNGAWFEFGNQGVTGKAVLPINMHGTRTANRRPAGRPKGQGVIQPFLYIIKPFQYCQVFPDKRHFEFLEIRFIIIIRIKAKDIKNNFIGYHCKVF